MEKKHFINRLSYTRAIACMAIVILHTTYAATLTFDASPLAHGIARSFTNLSMWAVPAFLMVSGALLLRKDNEVTISKTLRKYLPRVIYAIILFTCAYGIFDMALLKGFSEGGVLDTITNIISGNTWSTMWYLYMLAGIYLMLPFFKMVADNLDDKYAKYIVVLALIFMSILPLLRTLGYDIWAYIPLTEVYTFYLFAGYLLFNKKLILGKKTAVAGALISAAVIMVSTIVNYTNVLNLPEELWDYASLLTIVLAVSLVSLFFGMEEHEPGKFGKLLKEIDKYSFGIYLIHIMYVKLAYSVIGINPYRGMAPVNFAGLVIAIFILSYVTVKVLKLVPGINKVI